MTYASSDDEFGMTQEAVIEKTMTLYLQYLVGGYFSVLTPDELRIMILTSKLTQIVR